MKFLAFLKKHKYLIRITSEIIDFEKRGYLND